jgi:23S rRNA pseudouridine2457 synthase
MTAIYLFNKPFGVLTQFTDGDGRPVLADYIDVPGIYAAGRLDRDSEGLLVLTDNGRLQHAISDPRNKMTKTYLAQVEGVPDDESLELLRRGVMLKDGMTLPAMVRILAREPDWLWPRDPPIRYRASIPDTWIELTLTEGRNRQVRRMTAAVGHATLRLVRYAVGDWTISGLQPGQYRRLDDADTGTFAKAIKQHKENPRRTRRRYQKRKS